MVGGKFLITDVPGMELDAGTVRGMAERMAREMFPEKFKELAVISAEDFDRKCREAGLLEPENEQAVGESPISRLFSAVRAVLGPRSDDPAFDELRAAYQALNVDE